MTSETRGQFTHVGGERPSGDSPVELVLRLAVEKREVENSETLKDSEPK